MLLAQRAGLRVFATGGIGGVHRGHPEDVSADLPTLATTPVIVVCAGAKAILDLPRTLEFLETWGVPVLGWQTATFPAFYSREWACLQISAVTHAASCRRHASQRALAAPGLLVAAPVPPELAIPASEIEPLIAQAIAEAEAQGISGGPTPYLLARLVLLSEARSRRANESLLLNNAQIAAQIATQPEAITLRDTRSHLHMRALLVSQDPDEAAILSLILQRAGMTVTRSTDLEHALQNQPEMPADLILLAMPAGSPLAQVRMIRAQTEIPLVLVAEQIEEAMHALLLESGADLVVTRPFAPRLLISQVRALLRRAAGLPFFTLPTLTISDLTLHPATRTVQGILAPAVTRWSSACSTR